MRSEVDAEYSDIFTADDERMLILGNEMLWLLEEFPDHELSKSVLAFLDVSLAEDNDRALFNLCPRLEYNGKLIALKPPRDAI